MKMKPLLIGLLLVCCLPLTAQAEMDVRVVGTLKLDATPLDIAIPSSGDYIFVLTSDAVLKVFKQDGTLRDSLPVDPGVDGIKTGRREEQLYLLDSKNKRVQLLRLDFVHPIPVEGSPTKGSSQAKVTVAVFTDFQWPYCAKLAPILDQLIEKYPQDVRLVFKNYPLRNHKFARQAAAAALSAQAQGKFWEFHDQLFADYRSINEEKIIEIRDALGLQADEFDTLRKSTQVARQIQNDMRLGREVGLRGTPSVYINGRLQRGRNLNSLSTSVEKALKRLESSK